MVIKNTQKIESKNQIPKREQIPPENTTYTLGTQSDISGTWENE